MKLLQKLDVVFLIICLLYVVFCFVRFAITEKSTLQLMRQFENQSWSETENPVFENITITFYPDGF